MIYDKHLFICTNERKNSERKSCGEAHGLELISAFKEGLKKRNLPLKIRTQKTGCLDICDFGPTLVVYPEGVFYVGVSLSDVDEIIDSHLLNNQVVYRLLLNPDFKKKVIIGMEETDLKAYESNEKILLDLCNQLTKDIAIAGFEINFLYPVHQAFEQLFNQLLPLIVELEVSNKAKLNLILNRCDVSEQQLVKAIQEQRHKTFAVVVTELLIKRELQKVVIRTLYKRG